MLRADGRSKCSGPLTPGWGVSWSSSDIPFNH